jgi:hypothetical protein
MSVLLMKLCLVLITGFIAVFMAKVAIQDLRDYQNYHDDTWMFLGFSIVLFVLTGALVLMMFGK